MYLVTGATGLIGSYICRNLLRQGHAIRALRRKSSSMALVEDIQDHIEWVEGDLLDVAALYSHTEGIEGIVHSAAFISYNSRDEGMMQKVNVEGTANMVNVALAREVNYFLHISSVAAVGKQRSQQLIDETHKLNPTDDLTGYARSKWLSEMEVWRGISEGLPAAIVNPSLVLGPGELNRSSTQIFKYIQEQRRFYTSGVVNYVDVRDVAEVARKIMDAGLTGERYILSAGSATYKQLFDKVAQALDKRPPNIKVGVPLIKWVSALDQARTFLTKQPPLVSNELAQVAKNTHTYSSKKVEEALKIQFRSLEETVRWCGKELSKKMEKSPM